jgi:hypothetical protein
MRNSNLIKLSVFLSIFTVIALSTYSTVYIFPLYNRYIVEIAEKNATQLTTHLTKIFLNPTDDNLQAIEILAEHEQIFSEYIRDLRIYKLRIFATSGQIIYSSDKNEIGQVNTNSYFSELVAKGNSYSKTVEKEAKTREGDISKIDVIEIYVPIMNKGIFKGAMELYFDISEDKVSLQKIAKKTFGTIFPASLSLLIFIVLISLKANASFEKLRRAEAYLKASHEKIEQEVKIRTQELNAANEQLENEILERIQ